MLSRNQKPTWATTTAAAETDSEAKQKQNKSKAKATANQSDTPIYYLNIYITQFVPSQNQYMKLYDICMLFYSHHISQVEIGTDQIRSAGPIRQDNPPPLGLIYALRHADTDTLEKKNKMNRDTTKLNVSIGIIVTRIN